MSGASEHLAGEERGYGSQAEVLLEEMPAGVIATDGSLRVVYANRVAAELARKPRHRVLGRALWEICPDTEQADLERRYRRVLQERVAVEFETYSPPRDEWMYVRASPTDDGLVVYLSDVSAHRRAEKALVEQQAEQRRLLAAREEILAVVSHDLRNPLTTILGGLGLLARLEALPAGAVPIVARARRAAQRMRRLIGDLLDFSRIEQGTLAVVRRPMPVADVVAEAAESIRPVASERGQRLALEVPPELPRVLADRERLLQALGNLLDNALKHTPEGGVIGVSATAFAAGGVCVAVTDTGPGLGDHAQRQLFEPFWQAEPGREGAGLGLFIARAIVEAHGGHIWAESRPEGGTSFAFTLPASGDP